MSQSPEHTNIKAPRTRLIGRSEELASLYEALQKHPLVTVLGPPGIGKTRLVRELALRHLKDFLPGGAWFCDLSAATDLPSLFRALSQALSLTEEDPGLCLKALSAKEKVLLILDNAEHMLPSVVAAISQLQEGAPRAKLLVTSRERLKVNGELVFSLSALSFTSKEAEPSEAAALFIERAKAAQHTFTAENAQIEALVRRLDGLPFAIELAAARVRLLSVPQIMTRLSQRFQLLTGAATERGEGATLEGAISWSWELLSEVERSALSQCAVFPKDFSVEAAEAVLDLSRFSEAPWLLDVLQGLCDKSLLTREESARLGMLQSIRDYALARLPSEEKRAIQERHASYFLPAAEERLSEINGPKGEEALRFLSEERESLVSIHRAGLLRKDEAGLVWALKSAFIIARAFLGQAGYSLPISMLDEALKASASFINVQSIAQLRGRALDQRGRFHYLRGALQECFSDLEEARKIASALQDTPLLASVLSHQGAYFLRLRSFAEAESLLTEAASLFRALGDAHREGLCESQLALLSKKRGDFDSAEKHYTRSLLLRRSASDHPGEATSLLNLSYFLKGQGRIAEARLFLEQVPPLARLLQDRRLEAGYIGTLGALSQEEGDLPRAVELLEQALALLEEIGKKLLSGWFRMLLGNCYHELGRLSEARAQYERVLRATPEAKEQVQETLVWGYLGALAVEENRPKEAASAFSLASQRLQESPEPIAAIVLSMLEALHGGDLRAALEEAPLAPSKKLPSQISWDVRFARRLLARASEGIAAQPTKEKPTEVSLAAALVLGREARWFSVLGGERVDMSQRRPPRLLLLALAQHRRQNPDEALPVGALFECGWPNERAHPDAARNRVYTALNALRGLGLKDILIRRDDGYLLDPKIPLVEAE